MTIKKQGGIFGRNPTFNNVDVDGTLSVGSTITVANDSISGNAINGGTAVVDNLGVGIEPAYPLQVESSNTSFMGRIWNTGTDDNAAGLLVRTSATTTGALVSGVYSAHSGYIWKQFSNGNAELYGNLVLPSGNGIDFSATSGTGTSELFSDYEEGTWTPEFVDSAGANNCAAANGSNGAFYTKIGNQVTCSFRWNKSGGTAVGAYLDGLPFTPSSTSGKALNVSLAYGDATQGNANETEQYRFDSTARITLVGINLADLPSVMRAEFTYFTD